MRHIAGGENVASIAQLVSRAAGKFGRNTYIKPFETGIADISYADLERFVCGYRQFLADRAVGEQAVIACIFTNSTLMALLMVATMATGRRFVPLHPNHTARDVEYVCASTRPALVIYTARATLPDSDIFEHMQRCRVEDDAGFIQDIMGLEDTVGTIENIRPTTIAEYVFTSGSLGRPKGVILSHENLLANSRALVERYESREDDRFLTAVPLFHAGGQAFTTIGPLWVGATTTIVPPEIALVRFWEIAQKYEISWTVVMAAFLNVLVSHGTIPATQKLKGVLAGGSHIGAQLIRDFETRIGIPVYQVYGQTEMTSITVSEEIGDPRRTIGSGGKVLHNSRLRVMCAGRREASVNEVGEIWLGGPQRFLGYLNMPEATSEKLDSGFVKTGDMGFIDESGNLTILDRVDNMILVGGENVYPAEIEILACELPWLEDIIVTAIPHPILGSQLVMLYKVRKGAVADEAQLSAMLRRHLISSKVPTIRLPISVFGLEDWPRTPAGKLSRPDVRKLVRSAYEEHGVALIRPRQIFRVS